MAVEYSFAPNKSSGALPKRAKIRGGKNEIPILRHRQPGKDGGSKMLQQQSVNITTVRGKHPDKLN